MIKNKLYLVLFAIILLSGNLGAQLCEIDLRIEDRTIYRGQESELSIYLKNYFDTVAAFEIWLSMDNPDIMEFITQSDTILDTIYWKCLSYNGEDCLDSLDITDSILIYGVYPYDWTSTVEYETVSAEPITIGTLAEGWEVIRSFSFNGKGHDLKIIGMADIISPENNPGIGPQNGEIPLIKIPFRVYDAPTIEFGTTVNISIMTDNMDNYSISDEYGRNLGVDGYEIPDTSWFNCTHWYDETTCLYWERVAEGPADSMWCCDTMHILEPESAGACINGGTMSLYTGPDCGDYNGDGTINIMDITGTIHCIYILHVIGCDLSMMDVDNSGYVNILDLVYLIGYLYKGGPVPQCY
ncbi:MAG: dockerin type I repeat-containing protein [Candidatus Zixiibacteriota bacterium]